MKTELNILKFYGILLVVLGHVAFTYSPMSIISPSTPSQFLNFVKEVIYAFHMPLFFFVSGSIFAWQLEVKKKHITFIQLFINKFKRLLIPFYVFGILMVYPTMIILGFRDPIHYLIDGFLLVLDPRHLWFVYALFLMFLVFFLFRKICTRLKLPIWTVSIIALFLYCFPIEIINFQIKNVEHYFIWFSLGYLFAIYRHAFNYIAIAVICGIGINAIVPGLPPSILRLLLSFVGIAAFYILSVNTMWLENTKLYQMISPNSFGIYLFHSMIIYWLEFIAVPYEIHPIILSLGIFVITLTLSTYLTIGVRKLGLGIAIGERKKIN